MMLHVSVIRKASTLKNECTLSMKTRIIAVNEKYPTHFQLSYGTEIYNKP